jgi:hypothetical protein
MRNPFSRKYSGPVEWLGALYESPDSFVDGDEVIEPRIIMWLELPREVLVLAKLIDPRAPVSFADTFLEATTGPQEGRPRRPRAIRVPTAALAAELQDVATGIPVTVAPVEELDAAFDAFLEAIYEAFPDEEDFEQDDSYSPDEPIITLGPPARRADKPGRNDPCPCGSGKKYKKCHSGTTPPQESSESVHQMDRRMVGEIARFAVGRFGDTWAPVPDGEDEASLQLYFPLAAWTAVAGGTRVAEQYAERRREPLSEVERAWAEAQSKAWLSVFEVERVERGLVHVRDLLTGQRRAVKERLAAQDLVARDTLLARVVDFRGESFFGGMYTRAMPPSEAMRAVAAIRKELCVAKDHVPTAMLQDLKSGLVLLHQWQAMIDEYDERMSVPPVMTNTDGDPLLFITESFRFKVADRAEIESRIAPMEGIDSSRIQPEESEYVFVEPSSSRTSSNDTVVGAVTVCGKELLIDTNSEKRADAMARRIRDACAGLLGKSRRKYQSPADMAREAALRPAETKERAAPTLEVQNVLRQVKENHYRDWVDHPLPALGGKTPRAAVRSAKSRLAVDVLLRDLENHESRAPEGERFDVGILRRQLGLEE